MISRAQFTIIKNYDGDPGSPGASVQSVVRQFTISTSYNELVNVDWEDPNTPEWSTTEPNDIDADHYLWERFQTTLSDGTIVYSNAVCQRTISGVISRVNEVEGSITNKVWQTDITNSINSYDSNTTSTIRNRVSSVEQTINGYDVTVSGETTHVDGLSERMTSAEGRISVTEGNVLIQATQNDTAAQAGQHIIESFINVAPSNIRISADRINFEGSAVFSSFVTDQDLEAMQTDIEQYARNLTSDMATNTSVSNTYATKTTAIKRSQRIYKQTNQVDANNNPVVPDPATDLRNPSTNLDTWVATNVAVYDTWTTKRMSYSRDYPYIWTCEQRETVSGELAYTPVLLDDTTTVIDGGSIITNSIAANRIIAHSITSNELATNVITSSNYSPPTGDENSGTGTYPYSASGTFLDLSNGNIYTPNFMLDSVNGKAYLSGTIETGAGHIGGFTITDTSIYNNMKSFDDEIDLSNYSLDDNFYLEVPSYYVTEDGEIIDSFELDEDNYIVGVTPVFYGVYIGTDGIALGRGKFKVDSFGNLFANSATIKGNITATSGSFGSTNGYYEISDDSLVGYRLNAVYYFKMIEILTNDEYDEGSVVATSLSVETSNQSYSYSDILAITVVTGIDLKKENDKLFIILKTNSTTPISEIFDGTITDITCSYTYTQSGEEVGGFGSTHSYTGLTTPSTETDDYISGTELGYDYLKTDKIIASSGIKIVDNNLSQLASFGSTIQIGKDGSTQFFIDSDSLQGLNKNKTSLFAIELNGANRTTEYVYKDILLENNGWSDPGIEESHTAIAIVPPMTSGTTFSVTIRIHRGQNFYGPANNFYFTYGTSEIKTVTAQVPENGVYANIVYTLSYNGSNQLSMSGIVQATGQTWWRIIMNRITIIIPAPSYSLGMRIGNDGAFSTIIGENLYAEGENQLSIGRYNREDINNTYSFIIGNGTSDSSRSNAFTVDWDGMVSCNGISSIKEDHGVGYHKIFCGDMTQRAEQVDTNLSNSSTQDAWLTATIKAICIDYPNKNNYIFEGLLQPGSLGRFWICIYNTSDITSNLPRYSFGEWRAWSNHFRKIWTNKYVFYSEVIGSSS